MKPAGRPLLTEGLKWIYAGIGRAGHRHWDTHRLGETLAMVARTCWDDHRTEIERDGDLKTSFLGVLGILAERQEPQGLELRDEVSRAT